MSALKRNPQKDQDIFEVNTRLAVGDRIRLEGNWGAVHDFTVEEFRQCLGVFWSDAARRAGEFTPLCSLWGHGAGSSNSYISNYGEYIENAVPLWMNLPK